MGGVLGRVALPGLLSGPRAPGPRLLARPNSGGSSWTRERTLVAVKPDGVQRRLVGNAIQRFERSVFKLVGMKMLQAPERVLVEHYHDLRRKPFYPALISYRTSGPVVAMVWEGPNVVCSSRTMVTPTQLRPPPAPSGGTSASTSAGTSFMPMTPWRRPRGRSSYGFRAVSWWTELVDENHESSIYAA